MTIRDYNNLLIRAGTNHILFDFSLKLRRELLNHNSGAYNSDPVGLALSRRSGLFLEGILTKSAAEENKSYVLLDMEEKS